jgi:hypothetical protein
MLIAGELLGSILHLVRVLEAHFAVVVVLALAMFYVRLLAKIGRKGGSAMSDDPRWTFRDCPLEPRKERLAFRFRSPFGVGDKLLIRFGRKPSQR